MTDEEIKELDRQVRAEAQKKYLTPIDLDKIKRDDKTFLEYAKEMLETGSACIEANGNCNICNTQNKCKLPKTKLEKQENDNQH